MLAAAGLLGTPKGTGFPGTATGPSPIWKLGWGLRGQKFNELYGDQSFPSNYPVIDKIPNGVATSVKSIDLNAVTYQNEVSLTYRLNKYVENVQDFEGANWAGKNIRGTDIDNRAVQIIVPKGSITDANQKVIDSVRTNALKDDVRPVNIIITEF